VVREEARQVFDAEDVAGHHRHEDRQSEQGRDQHPAAEVGDLRSASRRLAVFGLLGARVGALLDPVAGLTHRGLDPRHVSPFWVVADRDPLGAVVHVHAGHTRKAIHGGLDDAHARRTRDAVAAQRQLDRAQGADLDPRTDADGTSDLVGVLLGSCLVAGRNARRDRRLAITGWRLD
jgi:hypothetical protein